jgi:hypothetical protein
MPTDHFQLSRRAPKRVPALTAAPGFNPNADDPLFRPIDAVISAQWRAHDFSNLRQNG